MRWWVLLLLFWDPISHAQERLELEVQLIDVFPWEWPDDDLDYDYSVTVGESISMVHRAMEVLGIFHDEYNIRVSDDFPLMSCDTASALEAQSCDVPYTGYPHSVISGWSPDTLESWTDFLKSQTHFPNGIVPNVRQFKLLLLVIPEGWAVDGWLGVNQPWARTVDGVTGGHWTQRACTAGVWVNSPNSMLTIAHELGHCFGLVHNEDDLSSYDIDLMLSTLGGNDFLHYTNQQRIRRQFIPTSSEPLSTPMIELQSQH